jgi:hypothetical protein
MLYEESNLFWTFYGFFFLFAVLKKKPVSQLFVIVVFIFAVAISYLHWHLVAPVDLLFFGRLLLFLMACFLMMPLDAEKATLVYFLGFVQVLVGAALTHRSWLFVYLIFFLFWLCYELLILQFHGFYRKLGRKTLLIFSFKLTLFLLFFGYIMFVLFPRTTHLLSDHLSFALSGFSSRVNLNSMNNILQSDKVVFRAKTPHPTYYRGVALSYFDGRIWSAPDRSGLLQADFGLVAPAEENAFGYFRDYNNRNPVRDYEVEISLLPMKQEYLFVPSYAYAIALSKGRFAVDRSGNILPETGLTTGGLDYRVKIADLNIRLPLTEPEIPTATAEEYLQLPRRRYLSEPVRELALSLTRDSATYKDKVEAVMAYFRTGFRYSLRSRHEGNPIDSFLLRNKSGHCEYFASAMVLLLRLNGIPARLVNGFNEGSYNEFGDYYAVRSRDAHAWVEVYAGDGLWVTMDPTPPAPGSFFDSFPVIGGFLKRMDAAFEYFDAIWQTRILHFSKLDQQMFFIFLRDLFRSAGIRFVLAVLFLLSLFVFLLRLYFRSFEYRRTLNCVWVRRLDFALQKKGFIRPPAQGLREFISGLDMEELWKQRFLAMQELIYKLKFSSERPENTKTALFDLWRQVRREL